MGAALGAAIVAPWLVWLPYVRGAAAIDLLGAVAIAGAWHGWGRVVARLARREADALLAIAWGAAATIALAGVLVALHVYDARLLVIGGTVAHSADLALRFDELRERAWRPSRHWIIPAAFLALIAIVAVLASAGQTAARAFDDDGNLIAQLQRLATTGTLGDIVGYPRASQLGGHAALAGLATAFADPNRARLVDGGVALALVLALACARLRPRTAAGSTWAVVLAIAACTLGPVNDLVPVWTPALLVVAFDATAGPTDRRGLLPLVLLAGALATLRLELAPLAAALLAAGWWLDRRHRREDRVRVAILFGGFVAVLVPYAVSRAQAWRGADPSLQAMVDPAHGGLPVRLALFALIAAVMVPLALFATRELDARRPRAIVVAIAVGGAGIAAQLFGERGYAGHLYWPLAIAAVVVIAISIAPRRGLSAIAVVLTMLLCVLVHDAQAATGRLTSWSWRVYDLMFDVEYARHAAPEGGDYEQLLARVPHDDAIAVWVARPELLDYAAHHVIDLRTPRLARDRESDRVARVVGATQARWLLVEDDVPRALEDVVRHYPVAARGPGLRLVELR